MQFKTFLFALLFFGLSFTARAQESAIDQISKATCDCMSKKELADMSQAQFEQDLGMCMFTAATPLMEQLQEEENIDLNDSDAFQKVGEKVGTRIATSCPVLFTKMMEFYGAETETEVRQLMVMEGNFAGIKAGDIALIQLDAGNGSTMDFLWLEAFEGSQAFENGAAALKGKGLKVFYTEKAFYSAQNKAYQTRKVVQRVEIK